MNWDEEIKKQFKYVGENVFIGKYCVFTNPSEVVLYDRVRIDTHNLFTTALEIGSNSQIMSHVVISGGAQHKVTLDGNNFIGYGSQLFCGSEDYSGKHGLVCDHWFENKVYHGDIAFKKSSGVASMVMVFPGVTLPEGCCIGAKGMVRTKQHLTPWSVWYGNPLKFQQSRTQSEGKLKEKWI